LAALTDGLLLERVRQGDGASFETLFYRHYDRVYGVLYRLVGNREEAEDLTQEVFVKLYHHAFTRRLGEATPTDASRQLPRARDEENTGAWLYRVATNLGYDALKKRRRRWQRDAVLLPESEEEAGAEDEVTRREQRAAVRRALAQLPERDVQLLVLREMGLSYAELAAVCHVAPGSVGTLLARAARAFRAKY
jgi:RNA polymerase sigma-70 factor (ECF subfamily)